MAVVLLGILIVILSLFTYFDVWYFTRFILLYILTRKRNQYTVLSRDELLRECISRGVVLPSDIDFNLHMNNSKYLREFDFSRVSLYFEKGMRTVLLNKGAVCLVNAINIRYRRSLQLLQTFTVKTKIIYWEEKAMYLEQRIVTLDGFVAAIAHVKMAVRGVTANELMNTLCGHNILSPLPSNELKSWQDSINTSSKHLREESATGHNTNSSSTSTAATGHNRLNSTNSSSTSTAATGHNRLNSTNSSSTAATGGKSYVTNNRVNLHKKTIY